ncbi:MAG TPA: MFS transporter [Xanthobacteraceae bacterium]|nr:MFS transporter [Xanthobacteraceae bacterium]
MAHAVGTERAHSGTQGLAALALAALLSSLGISTASVALPSLAAAFDASVQQVQWVVLAYLLAVTAFVVSVGRLGDVVGRRSLLLIGIAMFTLGAAASGAAPTLALLIAARAMQGLGAAVMMALSLAFVGDSVPAERIGRAMGLLATMSALGTALGPSLGGILIAGLGWRALFLVTVPLGVVAHFLVRRGLPEDGAGPANRPGFDVAGTALLALTLAAYALATTIGRGHFGLLNAALLLAAAVGALAFVHVEARVAAPLVRLAMLREPGLAARLAMNGLVSTVMMATMMVGPFYLTEALGLRTATVGLVLSAGPLATALAGVPAGRLVDRFGSRIITAAGLVVAALGCLALALLATTLSLPGYIVALAVLTSGYAVFQTANTTAVMSGIEPDRCGVVSGLINLSRNLGLTTGASMMGAVFALSASTPPNPAVGLRVTFIVAALLIVVALVLGFRSFKTAR